MLVCDQHWRVMYISPVLFMKINIEKDTQEQFFLKAALFKRLLSVTLGVFLM